MSKSDFYFSLNLYHLAEDYHKMTLLSISLRYFKSNFKVISDTFKENKKFLSEIIVYNYILLL